MYHIFFLTIFKDFKYYSNLSRKIHYIENFKFVTASGDSLKQLPGSNNNSTWYAAFTGFKSQSLRFPTTSNSILK